MKLPLLIIGPQFSGKNAVGRLLASELAVSFIPLWQVCEKFWHDMDFDKSVLDPIWQNDNKDQADWIYRYMMPFDAKAVERGVTEYANCVIELAPPQSVYDDTALFNRVSQILQPYPVVLLLPSEDVDVSLQMLTAGRRMMINGMERNEYFVRDHANYDLAKHPFFTKEKTPAQTCDEIMDQLKFDDSNIVFIGPRGTGKTTVGRLLAERLGRTQVSMDTLRFQYYAEAGWGPQAQQKTFEDEGHEGYYRRWQQFRLTVVERILNEHQNCVIDFGAGHSVFEDEVDFKRVYELLAPYPNVILLMPSPDRDESITILEQRNTPMINGMVADRFFVTHPSNWKLAKQVVYTQGKTPSEVKDEILAQFGQSVDE